MMNTQTIIREFMNGIWAISSFYLLFVIFRYLFNATLKVDWRHNPGVKVAVALSILISGHVIRSFTQWINFALENASVYANVNALPGFWAQWWYLIPATLLAVIGKLYFIYALSPPQIAVRETMIALTLTISIPLLVFWVI